jgi:hypothetical protein
MVPVTASEAPVTGHGRPLEKSATEKQPRPVKEVRMTAEDNKVIFRRLVEEVNSEVLLGVVVT